MIAWYSEEHRCFTDRPEVAERWAKHHQTPPVELRAEEPWPTIDSAPMDGTNILGWEPRWTEPGEMSYYPDDGNWYLAGNAPSDAHGGPVYPTHWRHMPRPSIKT